jgi:cobalt/nickel transport system permease protein
VFISAVLALSELRISGVTMPASILGISLGLFLISGLLEGAITLAVIQALESIQPNFIRKPAGRQSLGLAVVSTGAILMAVVGVLFGATDPDGIQRLGQQTGIASQARTLLATPLKGYEVSFLQSSWLSKAGAGLSGLGLIYLACLLIGRTAGRNRST